MLDEPTASLPADEVARLFAALRRLRAHGVGMIYVSHRLDEVFEIADRMVVLRDGRVAGERIVAETTPDETILLIVGREPSQVFRRPAERRGRAAARASRRSRSARSARSTPASTPARSSASSACAARARRVVGRALFGVEPMTAGASCSTASRRLDSPREAMALGVNLVCADRVGEVDHAGPVGARESVPQSARAAGRALFAWLSPARGGAAPRANSARRSACGRTIRRCAIELLSGGNQQKVVVGRWLHLAAKIYVFEDPTAGVDVGAKAEIYRLFDVALQGGAAILIVSTDFEEVAKVCHRALVFDRGRVVAELCADDLSVENLLAAASANIGARPPTGASPEAEAPCSPSSRTRWSRRGRNSPGCRRGKRSCAWCRSTACPF